ncbi:MAG: hypothetical protein EZS28_026392 [Streblomastix strix]|uniref:Uncharacterized protein n=1 Tax=Streblomastix strix TaxID=222440 RepID=A0A5J4V6L3_9EUKA|nr:MAG: hypothetical protein EZS28_026392 [Streblomastix strix]
MPPSQQLIMTITPNEKEKDNTNGQALKKEKSKPIEIQKMINIYYLPTVDICRLGQIDPPQPPQQQATPIYPGSSQPQSHSAPIYTGYSSSSSKDQQQIPSQVLDKQNMVEPLKDISPPQSLINIGLKNQSDKIVPDLQEPVSTQDDQEEETHFVSSPYLQGEDDNELVHPEIFAFDPNLQTIRFKPNDPILKTLKLSSEGYFSIADQNSNQDIPSELGPFEFLGANDDMQAQSNASQGSTPPAALVRQFSAPNSVQTQQPQAQMPRSKTQQIAAPKAQNRENNGQQSKKK